MNEIEEFLRPVRHLHETIRDRVVAACEAESAEAMSSVVADEEGDTIFAIDRVSEELLVEFFASEIAPRTPIVLIAEGIENGKVVLPCGTNEADAKWRVIMDPIDGTRGLMYQKRPGWILTGIAPNRGEGTTLRDIEFAIQTEIPLVKQYLSDVLWAFRGRGASAERWNRIENRSTPLELKPSAARSIEQGYATISRFFPGTRDVLAAIDDEIVATALGRPKEGKAQAFEDQYISTGGQLYELMTGHDRFIADIRPLMRRETDKKGSELSICCHPYDLCTESIAKECGILVTDEYGEALSVPLNVETDVSWVGYANASIREQVEPAFRSALMKRGLVSVPMT